MVVRPGREGRRVSTSEFIEEVRKLVKDEKVVEMVKRIIEKHAVSLVVIEADYYELVSNIAYGFNVLWPEDYEIRKVDSGYWGAIYKVSAPALVLVHINERPTYLILVKPKQAM
jgi:hypothetical protein